MPRPRPPYLHSEFSRHGKRRWYVRVKKGPRVRIPGEYGTLEFMAAYHAAIAGAPELSKARKRSPAGTFAWAMELYRESADWRTLAPATRKQRENIMRGLVEAAGDQPLAAITRAKIMQGIDARSQTPFAARHFVETLRGLFAWATAREFVTVDPTQGVKVAKPKSEGFLPWTAEEIETYWQKWPRGTRQRVWFDVLLFTGVRRGDAVTIGRQHVKDGIVRLATEKTGERVAIPIHPELQATLDAGPCGDLAWIVGERGDRLTKESFGNLFRAACNAAGVKKSAHGLRKTGATADAQAGYTEAELEAKYGWRGGRMASFYTRSMDRERLAIQAAEKSKKRTSMPAPEGKTPAPSKKGV